MTCNYYACVDRGNFLDIVPDCISETCIKVLRQFISNRESLQVISSGNGELFASENAQNFVNSLNIKWKFNIEGAPWTYGFYEILMRSVKRCLKRSLVM